MTSSSDSNSLAIRRKQASLIANTGRKIGYSIFFLALIIFAIGFTVEFNNLVAKTLTVLLIVGSIVLAPSILLHYAVRGAEREEKEQN
ncbi:MAG: hypothetical protein QF837_03305 [Acidimicrobiales bacterium]|jgi:uncharacterized membrane protein|nr:hypothetical protein [Acidimicrobiaceae bacterium]MDG2351391.1 hypothetical protein [Acidimicrobiales bacterium]MDP6161688.1 hypothetical protein [Acidimicrobiales bacterium]MDP6285023.1 hypothetical protein [Acidimicrobiales bacterium]|tara:strand:+ start:8222 stop:8485 length:264 start_codon:yes stop_codon:yes gene_type:complete